MYHLNFPDSPTAVYQSGKKHLTNATVALKKAMNELQVAEAATKIPNIRQRIPAGFEVDPTALKSGYVNNEFPDFIDFSGRGKLGLAMRRIELPLKTAPMP